MVFSHFRTIWNKACKWGLMSKVLTLYPDFKLVCLELRNEWAAWLKMKRALAKNNCTFVVFIYCMQYIPLMMTVIQTYH